MVILLYGEDDYRSLRKLNEIISQYQSKHQTGLNLMRLREGELDFDKVEQTIEMVSMFNEKKLIILENVFKDKDFKEKLFEYLKKNKIKNNEEIIIVIREQGKLAVSKIKTQITMKEEFNSLTGQSLINWIKREVTNNRVRIDLAAIRKLAEYAGNDLWLISGEIAKLLDYVKEGIITEKEVDLLVKAKADINIFKTLDALACQNKRLALKYLHQHLNQGENEIYLFTMLIYQIRNLIKLKDLMERGVPFYSLAHQSGLHPFVVKKSSQVLKNFSLEQLRLIYRKLLEIEFKLKTGQIDGPVALDLLVIGI